MPKTLRSPAHARLLALLRETREGAGVTQAELARRLGRPQSFVSKIEGGERRLDPVEFAAVFLALGADPGEAMREIAGLVDGPAGGARVGTRGE
jgi:transcriptional regulator with XRE-family HTH domain